MKVYLVYWCNNEEWEDYNERVMAVFSTAEKATGYILDKDYKPHECEGEWEKEHWADRYDSEPDEWGEYSSMWVVEAEVDLYVNPKAGR